MIYPIVAYGDPVLKKVAEDISEDYTDLKQLIASMFETMYDASGVGLAAPQIGLPIRLFVVDASPFGEIEEDEEYTEEELAEMKELSTLKKVFINAVILEESGKEWSSQEGCLSIPGVREDVLRKPNIVIEYYDENWELQEKEFKGIAARIIQHEYDHIEGVLFTEKIAAIRRQFVRKKLADISIGKVKVDYKMKFPKRK